MTRVTEILTFLLQTSTSVLPVWMSVHSVSSARTRWARTSAAVRLDTDWQLTGRPAMVRSSALHDCEWVEEWGVVGEGKVCVDG